MLENFLLIGCLSTAALRSTVTEGLNIKIADLPSSFAETAFGLTVSTLLISFFVIWLVLSFCSKNTSYRFSGVETGLLIFSAAAVLACLAASNKRAAITSCLSVFSAIAAAVLLIQLLDSNRKVRLVLVVIAALGVVSAWQCEEQFFYFNDQQIELYEQDPDAQLASQNIKPDGLQRFQFEHRLYSKGVNGFFTTRNSAGCFFLLSLSAVAAIIIEQLKNSRSGKTSLPLLLPSFFAAGAIGFGLAITKSKAAITAAVFAAVMLFMYFRFGAWLNRYKSTILLCCFLIALIGVFGFVACGLTSGKLPGGDSMLVRWQYWAASIKMFADRPISGVGPGNFNYVYTQYKNPAALEAVADPHNFILSILTQFGLLGLLGFLVMFAVPLWKTISPSTKILSQRSLKTEPNSKTLSIVSLLSISAVLLIVRPVILTIPFTGSPQEKNAAAFILHIMPVIIFAAGGLLLAISTQSWGNTNATVAILFCGLVGCLAHNLIDFALFEPGIFTTFWVLFAALAATNLNLKKSPQPIRSHKSGPFLRAVAAAFMLVLLGVCIKYGLAGPLKSAAKIQQAHRALLTASFEDAHKLLAEAAEGDRLNPAAVSLNGRLYIQHYDISGSKQKGLLLKAESCLLEAVRRNRADYKNHNRLAGLYLMLAQGSAGAVSSDWLGRSFAAAADAVKLYPGCGSLRFDLARIAELLGKNDTALDNYKKAVEIEDAFRNQFKRMYPDHEIVSRLGENKYQTARLKINQLSGKDVP